LTTTTSLSCKKKQKSFQKCLANHTSSIPRWSTGSEGGTPLVEKQWHHSSIIVFPITVVHQQCHIRAM
jgi:hypothetical protein